MPSYKNFQRDNKKYGNTTNLFKRPKNMSANKENLSSNENMRLQIKKWTSFYRLNLHRFIEHYFGIELFFFQKLSLFLMNLCSVFTIIASRGISKSYTIAIFCCAISVLKPNSKIIIAAGTKGQAALIIKEKIQKELMQFPNLAREIKEIKTGQSQNEVIFHNGSSIVVVASKDTARGYRATIIIYEEFRLIKKDIIDTVLSPFLISRQAPFLKKSEYSHLKEEPMEIYISSAYYKNGSYMWDLIKTFTNSMINTKETYVLAFDYLLSVFHGLKTQKQMEKEKEKSDEISFMIEYENIMFGENANAFFKLDMFRRNQKLKKAFYPVNKLDFLNKKKNPFKIEKQEGEIRIISADISTIPGEDNDNSVFVCMRLLPTSQGYERQIPYVQSMNGGHTTTQALRIQQLFMDFEANYIVLDTQSAGIGIYDELGKVLFDEERNIEYLPLTCFNDEDLKNRTLAKNAIPIIYSIKGNAQLNSNIALKMRDILQKNMIKFLIDANEAEQYLFNTNKEYQDSNDALIHAFYEAPYYETSALINETVNLEYLILNGNVKIQEQRKNRKDRYVSMAYANYFASELERNLENQNDSYDFVFTCD